MWGIDEIKLISQRENNAPSWEVIGHEVPNYLDLGSGRRRLHWEALSLVLLLFDLSYQLRWMFAITGRIAAAEVEGVEMSPGLARGTSWVRGWTSVRTFRLYRHLPSSSCLATSAKTCHLCAMFWQELSTEQQTRLLRYDQVLESTVGLDLQLRASRCICIAFDKERGDLIALFGDFRRPRRWVYPARGHDSDLKTRQFRGLEAKSPITVSASDIGNLHLPNISDTGSDLSVEVVRRWLHLSKAPLNPDWIPSRLVDVSALSTGTICIKHRQDVPLHNRQYLALSHCWGHADYDQGT